MILNRIKVLDEENSRSPPATHTVLAERYERDETLTGLLKTLRGDTCQICGSSFRTRDGRSYTECHHLEHLAQGGFDLTKNIIVLCANHHRQFHYGDVAVIEHTPDILSVSIDGQVYRCSLALDPMKAPPTALLAPD